MIREQIRAQIRAALRDTYDSAGCIAATEMRDRAADFRSAGDHMAAGVCEREYAAMVRDAHSQAALALLEERGQHEAAEAYGRYLAT